ncbi:CDP-alcohol phosphatidyltransferase family protein [Spirosoma koreense]
MRTRIPIALIFSRLCIGLTILLLSLLHIDQYRLAAILLLIIGLLTDIFDGIIARYLAVSTQNLRRLDSTIDQIFFISFAVATYIQCPVFFKENSSELIVLFGSEVLTYIISFLKFRKEVATHSIGAKIWTLLLVATLIELIIHCQSTVLFTIFFWTGLLTRLEIIAILVTLKTWMNDVPSFYHALKLRKGKDIKRHKWFNG